MNVEPGGSTKSRHRTESTKKHVARKTSREDKDDKSEPEKPAAARSNKKRAKKHAAEVDADRFDAEDLGVKLADDIALRTARLVCAVCSEKKQPFKLTTVVVKKTEIPAGVMLDEQGVVSMAPLQKEAFVQFYVCCPCLSNGHVFWKHAEFNVHGLGKQKDEYWWSEELCVATVSVFMAVRHAGPGGHSFKQESEGGVLFAYHNVLGSLWGLLEEGWGDEQVAVSRIREGEGAKVAKMMIRVKKMLRLFLELWEKQRSATCWVGSPH